VSFDLLVRNLWTDSGVSAGLAKVNAQLESVARSGPGARVGLRAVEMGARSLAFEAIGLEGGLGRVSAGLLQIGGGNALVLGAVAGIGAVAAAYQWSNREATQLAATNERLSKTWQDLTARGRPTIALMNAYTAAVADASKQQEELDRLKSPVLGSNTSRGTEGEIAAAQNNLDAANRVVQASREQLDRAHVELEADASQGGAKYAERFLAGIKNLDPASQIVSLLAVQHDPHFLDGGRQAALGWAQQYVAAVQSLEPGKQAAALLQVGPQFAADGQQTGALWAKQYVAAVQSFGPSARVAALLSARPEFAAGGRDSAQLWVDQFIIAAKALGPDAEIAALLSARPGMVAAGHDAGMKWGAAFISGLEGLDPSEQLAELLAQREHFEQMGEDAANAWRTAWLATLSGAAFPATLRIPGPQIMGPLDMRRYDLRSLESPVRGLGLQPPDFSRFNAPASPETLNGQFPAFYSPTGPPGVAPLTFANIDRSVSRFTPGEPEKREKPDAARLAAEAMALLGALKQGGVAGILGAGAGIASDLGGLKGAPGFLGPLGIGLNIASGLFGLFDNSEERRWRQQMEELRRIRQNTEHRGEPNHISVTVLLNGKEVSASILGDVLYGIRRLERTNGEPILPPSS
jgi:hypothetical protein